MPLFQAFEIARKLARIFIAIKKKQKFDMSLKWNLFAFSEQSHDDIDADKKSTRIGDFENEILNYQR